MRPPALPVEKRYLAHMLLDDLLDDGETETGAANPRRHVRFGQPFAVLGKSDAGVEHVDHQQIVLIVKLQLDTVAGKAVLTTIPSTFNGFYAVLDDICQGLGELSAITDHAEIALRRLEREGNRGMSDLVEE